MLPRFLTVFIWLVFMSCGNPELHYYLLTKSQTVKKGEKQFPEFKLKESVILRLSAVTPEEIDNLAERLSIYSEQRYYRLPGLSYIKFRVINKSKENFSFNLFASRFRNDLKEEFPAIGLKEYESRFTSVAYSRFPPEKMYSFYVTREGKKKAGKEIYLDQIPPGDKVTLKPDSEGFQVVPYERLSIGARQYVFEWKDSGFDLTVPFFYCTSRADAPSCK